MLLKKETTLLIPDDAVGVDIVDADVRNHMGEKMILINETGNNTDLTVTIYSGDLKGDVEEVLETYTVTQNLSDFHIIGEHRPSGQPLIFTERLKINVTRVTGGQVGEIDYVVLVPMPKHLTKDPGKPNQ
jgi:hypothetical protein